MCRTRYLHRHKEIDDVPHPFSMAHFLCAHAGSGITEERYETSDLIPLFTTRCVDKKRI